MLDNITQFIVTAAAEGGIWWQLGVALGLIIISLLVRRLFTCFIFTMILKLTKKTKTDLDSAALLAFKNPIQFLIVLIGLYLAINCFVLSPAVAAVIIKFFRSAVIIAFVWGLYNLVGGEAYHKLGEKFSVDEIIASFVTKALRIVIVALAIAIIAQEWDYDVNGFLAGLGLGGLAFALAAQDVAKNIFGGIVIILDKPFEVGDWILTSSVEGTVEEVNFRSTKVRTFANALVTVPNSVVANQAITNWSRMEKRRISFNLGVTYATSRAKLQSCVQRINTMLCRHPEIDPDTLFVRFDQFNESSLDIFIYYFTKTTVWGDYLAVKEDVNFKIMEILEDEGVSVAFPSRSLYFEKGFDGEADQLDDSDYSSSG